MMKKVYFILFAMMLVNTVLAQKKVDNYSFMKLYVTNNNGEVLLLGNEALEITGARYNDSLSVKEFVKWMGRRMGIEIKNIRLRGLLTFHYEWRENPTLMHYYTAEYKNGELILPKGCKEIKWVSIEDAYKLIPYNEMNLIIQKINSCDYLFGGSFRIKKDGKSNKRKGEFIEPFYRLN